MNPRRVGRLLVLALFAALPFGAAGAQEADDEAASERFIQRRIPGMTREERDARARANGSLRISGRVRAYGKLFATSVHVEPGAEVDASEGLVVYSLGPIVVDGRIQGAPRRRPRTDVPGSVGANGADGAAITMISAEDVTVNEPIVGNPGQEGAEAMVMAPSARGGRGGRGGDVTIRVTGRTGTITVNALVEPGYGGHGGFAQATGALGAPGRTGGRAVAVGGEGGDAGRLLIQATNLVFGEGGAVQFPRPSSGGDADALGGNGGAAPACFESRSGGGGDARALGGRAGRGSEVIVHARSLLPAGVGADSFVRGADLTGAGGPAYAVGGRAGDVAAGCDSTADCPDRGRRGAATGDGGDAYARGGDGQLSSRILGQAFAGRTPASVEDFPANGGSAQAVGGGSATAGKGEDGFSPGVGGAGGRSGASAAYGGRGANCRVGLTSNGLVNTAGKGGDAVAGQEGVAVAGGAGGFGGNCCNHPGGVGGLGGRGGAAKPQQATGGKGGSCRNGVDGEDGTRTVKPANAGMDGLPGYPCPGLAYELTVTPNPTTHGQATTFGCEIRNSTADPVQVTVQLFHLRAGKPPYLIREQTVTVPGGTLESPGTITVNGFGSPPTAGNNQGFQVKVEGRQVGRVNFDVR